jgi:hypothetical protein
MIADERQNDPHWPHVFDRGPWSVMESEGRVFVQSDDFTHDVCMRVSGDFAEHAERLAYAADICRRLNAPDTNLPPSRPEIEPSR